MAQFLLGKEKNTNKIISISEALNGLSCNCVCPKCGEVVMAVQGKKNEWHFRHYDESVCKGGQETALHEMAKQIIIENSAIHIPTYGHISYSNPVKEKSINSFVRPDVTVNLDDEKCLYVEILVSNPVDSEKEKFYCDHCYNCIEINLKGYEFTSKDELVKEVLFNDLNKKIIYWQKKIINKPEETPVEDSNFLLKGLAFLGVIGVGYMMFGPKKKQKKRKENYF